MPAKAAKSPGKGEAFIYTAQAQQIADTAVSAQSSVFLFMSHCRAARDEILGLIRAIRDRSGCLRQCSQCPGALDSWCSGFHPALDSCARGLVHPKHRRTLKPMRLRRTDDRLYPARVSWFSFRVVAIRELAYSAIPSAEYSWSGSALTAHFRCPVAADDGIEAFRREGATEKIASRLDQGAAVDLLVAV